MPSGTSTVVMYIYISFMFNGNLLEPTSGRRMNEGQWKVKKAIDRLLRLIERKWEREKIKNSMKMTS